MTDTWRRVCVEDVCESVGVGIVIQPAQYYTDEPDGIRALRSANVGLLGVVDSDWVHLTPEGDAANSRSRLRAGDVVVVRSGAPGLACVITEEFAGSNCIDLVIARPNRREVLPEYLAAFTNSPGGVKHVNGSENGLALKHFNVGAYKGMELLLPPLDEQRRIVGVLQTWDEALALQDRLIAAKERRRHALIEKLFDPTRTLGRHGCPKGWRSATFGDLFQERQDRNHGLGAADVVTVGKSRIGKQIGHFTRSVASANLAPYWVISPGDFVYDPMSAYYGALGRYDANTDGLVSPAYRVLRLDEHFNSDFVAALLKVHHIRFQLDAQSTQGNKSGKRRVLQRSAFEGIEFNYPPRDEQRRIAATVGILDEDVAASKRRREAIARQKRGLMQKLLTGDWRVHYLEPEAASG